MMARGVIYAVVMAAAVVGCSRTGDLADAAPDVRAFAEAIAANTDLAYARFLAEHPDSDFADLARQLYTEADILGQGAAAASLVIGRRAIDEAGRLKSRPAKARIDK